MRTSKKIKPREFSGFRRGLLQWAQQFEEVVWLESNDSKGAYSEFDAVLAVDAFTAIKTSAKGAFDQLEEYQRTTKDWIFGYLSYDLKNDIEDLHSSNLDVLEFPDLYFFQPKKLFLLKNDEIEVRYLKMVDDEIEEDLEDIRKEGESSNPDSYFPVEVKPRISEKEYLLKVREMQKHIHRGDIYEANLCQEFYAENAIIDPLKTYTRLNGISRPPFAVYLKLYDHFLLSASPERFLRKKDRQLISQPIKGTAPRAEDLEEDQKLAEALGADPKERSENIMIVDLVRNDLSRIAAKASVRVEELCRVYSFRQVHQMISTITAELEEGLPPVAGLRSMFPMGSMTGAPKISAMKIIEELEESRRGLYSGSVGYFTPSGDFDFNVVIRSILYNKKKSYISFSVGGAITAKSIPENEYKECLLKVRALRQVLEEDFPPSKEAAGVSIRSSEAD